MPVVARRLVGWPTFDHEDRFGGDRGPGRVVLAARVTEHRAHRLGPRRRRAGGAEGCARQRLAGGQGELDLGLGSPGPSGPLEIASSRAGHLLDALDRAYDVLGFPQATGYDDVFRQLVLARIIEPTS